MLRGICRGRRRTSTRSWGRLLKESLGGGFRGLEGGGVRVAWDARIPRISTFLPVPTCSNYLLSPVPAPRQERLPGNPSEEMARP